MKQTEDDHLVDWSIDLDPLASNYNASIEVNDTPDLTVSSNIPAGMLGHGSGCHHVCA